MRMRDNSRRIHAVFYINVDECVTKRHALEANYHLAGVPEDRLIRFPSKLSFASCPDNNREIAQMMVDDGFPEYEYFLINESPYGAEHLASRWSKLALYRRIATEGINALVMSDSMFWWSYKFLTLEQKIRRLPDDLQIVNLYDWVDSTNPESMELHDKAQPSGVPGIVKGKVGCGFVAMFVTPEGALNLIKMLGRYPYTSEHQVLPLIAHKKAIEGYYSCAPSPLKSMAEYFIKSAGYEKRKSYCPHCAELLTEIK